MEILWIAIVLYSAGLAVVLHFRPTLMFNEDGTWKEFGYQRSPRHTLLPFWLFVIVWAFVSYAMAAAGIWFFSTPSSSIPASGLSALTATSYVSQMPVEEEDGEDDDLEETDENENQAENEMPMTSVSSMPSKRGPGRPRKDGSVSAAKPRQGYYVLENNGDGLHRYIYYGPDSPPGLA